MVVRAVVERRQVLDTEGLCLVGKVDLQGFSLAHIFGAHLVGIEFCSRLFHHLQPLWPLFHTASTDGQ